jgi:hypothetical protein
MFESRYPDADPCDPRLLIFRRFFDLVRRAEGPAGNSPVRQGRVSAQIIPIRKVRRTDTICSATIGELRGSADVPALRASNQFSRNDSTPISRSGLFPAGPPGLAARSASALSHEVATEYSPGRSPGFRTKTNPPAPPGRHNAPFAWRFPPPPNRLYRGSGDTDFNTPDSTRVSAPVSPHG